MPVINEGTAYYIGDTPVQHLYAGAVHVWPMALVLTDITPDSMLHSDGPLTLTATGENFTPDCVLYIDNTAMQDSTFVSRTQMTGTVDMLARGTGNPYQVTVRAPAGVTSNPLPFVSTYSPTLTDISPDQMYAGTPQLLTVRGTNFYAGMKVRINGWDTYPATIVSTTEANIQVPGNLSVGVWNISVVYTHSVDDEELSNTLPLSVVAVPLPTVTSVTGIALGYAVNITVNGTNFTAPMTLEFGNNGGDCQPPLGPFTVNVISPTLATSTDETQPGCPQPHWSLRGTNDLTHDARVTTPAGTSAWLPNQYVGLN